MKKFIFIYFLFFLNICLAQKAPRKFYFQIIHWSINLPADFVVLDSAQNAAINKKGIDAIEETNNIKADMSDTKTLITATKNNYNYFSATLTPFDPKQGTSYAENYQSLKTIFYKTMSEKVKGAKVDSSSRTTMVDNLSFDEFQMKIKVNEQLTINMVLLSRYYKGFDFGISYVYLDPETRKEIQTILDTSKFEN